MTENEPLLISPSQQTSSYQSTEWAIKKRNKDHTRSLSTTSQETAFMDTSTKIVKNDNADQQDSILSHKYWQAVFMQYTTSVYLENKGSVARDHLANERTYLAWLRTSLSTISVGIGLTQLFRLEKSIAHPINQSIINGQLVGILFIVISILFLSFAFIRYFHAQVAMMAGYFPASRSTVLIATSTLFITMVFILIFVGKQ